MEQIFSISYSNTVSGCILRAVYNTHVHGKYCNILLDDSSLTSCLIVTIKGTGTILLKDKTQIQLSEKTYYIGTHSDIHGLSSSCDHWHYSCFWFNPVGLNYADHLLLTNRDCDPEEEDRFATELISLIQSGDSNNIKLGTKWIFIPRALFAKGPWAGGACRIGQGHHVRCLVGPTEHSPRGTGSLVLCICPVWYLGQGFPVAHIASGAGPQPQLDG